MIIPDFERLRSAWKKKKICSERIQVTKGSEYKRSEQTGGYWASADKQEKNKSVLGAMALAYLAQTEAVEISKIETQL